MEREDDESRPGAQPEADAPHELLKALVNLDVRVASFEAKTQTLEDTFMRITQGKLQ